LLTVESIQHRAVHLAGWVANHLHPADAAAEAAVAALGARIPAPLLGAVPWLPAFDVNVLANSLRLPDPGMADRFT
jgi:dethiobiotin synthetase